MTMMLTIPAPEDLSRHYHWFLKPGRVLLTGHSHQAWPDCACKGMEDAFYDAAMHVDDKWGHALAAADRVRAAVGNRIEVNPDTIALGANTHELIIRLLSALDLRKRHRIVTTTGEFHSLSRQLGRAMEEGIKPTFVQAQPVATLAERLLGAVDDQTAVVFVSSVLFETATIVPGLSELAIRLKERGVELVIDAYHSFNVVPLKASDHLEAWIVGGGYKYAQWGEGCAWLAVPEHAAEFRPALTGWFADFEHLGQALLGGKTTYGKRPADRFAGATYDPTSHYRARAVAKFFDEQRLDVATLRAISLRRTSQILDGLAGYNIATPLADEQRAGFIAVRVPNAVATVAALREKNIFVDARGEIVRIGPAPYTTDEDLNRALREFRALVPQTT